MTPVTSRSSIAIIDDDASVRVSLQRLCQVLGLTTTTYGSGSEFLASLDEGNEVVDCLLLDAHMPEMTGLELLRLLDDRGVRIPTIMLTGDDPADISPRYIAAGAVQSLGKPVSGARLLAAVEPYIRVPGDSGAGGT